MEGELRGHYTLNVLLSCCRDASPLTSQPSGMRNSKDSAVVLGDSLIRLKGRAKLLTDLHIDLVLMIIKGK